MYEVGDLVECVEPNTSSYRGERARVVKLDGDYVYVVWEPGSRSRGNGFFLRRFRRVLPRTPLESSIASYLERERGTI